MSNVKDKIRELPTAAKTLCKQKSFKPRMRALDIGHWTLDCFCITSFYDSLDVSANVEVAFNLHAQGIACLNEIFENDVDNVFVKNLHLSKRIDVQLQAFEFDATLVWDVLQSNSCEIREIGKGTDGRELGNLKIYFDFATREFVSESVQRKQIHFLARR